MKEFIVKVLRFANEIGKMRVEVRRKSNYKNGIVYVLLAGVGVTMLVCLLQIYPMSFVVSKDTTTQSELSLPLYLRQQHERANSQAYESARIANSSTSTKDVLLLRIAGIGEIPIVLRPDLSRETVVYIQEAVERQDCQRCNLYRVEKPGILQGVLKSKTATPVIRKGSCPKGFEAVANECPPWDGQCGCHGPIMTRGMVAWAAGQTGPDFFIDLYPKPAKWWGTQHTVWGEIQDERSLRMIDERMFGVLPVHEQGGLTLLDTPLPFEISLVKA